MDLGSTAMGILTGVGALAAGSGLFRAGMAVGRMADRIPRALETQVELQTRLAAANDRQALALEASAKLIPALESMHESREEIGITLRTMSRKLNELLRLNGQATED